MTALAMPGRRDRRRVMITPEGIALPIVLASRGARFGALALDLTFIFIAIFATIIALAFVDDGLFGAGLDQGRLSATRQFLLILVFATLFLLHHAWFLFFELGPRGATPGKRIVGVRIAARDGGRLTAEMVIARNLLRDIELFLPLVFLLSSDDGGASDLAATAWFLIFALFPLFNRDRLRAGDLIAGTWVVETPKRKLEAAMSLGAAAQGASGAGGATYRFGEAELSVYGEYELQTLERVLRDDRPEALAAVHEAICAKIGWNPGRGDERAFLDAFYTQLRARLEAGMRMGRRKADKFQ